ncbi:hypothetical protein KEM60_00963 [Austwickia sp. TVS 96-490-7B]|uniref:cytochrome c biogenesis CcdA family protein n=1 Tax=Austwickia sp. TVS 96-490-7B TaxID=2830843 RepID=UPI001C57B22C|nr:cytochrome c biogenesis protein CcdA [Austwickia sp. TVS 96-490-7B]MBW3084774.1 hypothetical protein [Austwickia sp. TVS 96-490-7B]
MSTGGVLIDGNLLVAALIAWAAGVVSFASPCVLPLVPGFLGYVTGLSADERDAPARRGRVLGGAALFVTGFSVVFLAGTVAASATGVMLAAHRRTLSMLGGILVLMMAAVFLGVGQGHSWSPRWRPAAGLAGAPFLGMVFAVGWAPCTGPTLAVIYTLATTTGADHGQIARGVALGIAYCLGLGAPFLVIAAGWSHAVAATSWLRRHHRGVQIGGGALLATVGVLLVTGSWDTSMAWVQSRLVGGFVPTL